MPTLMFELHANTNYLNIFAKDKHQHSCSTTIVIADTTICACTAMGK